MKRLVSIMTAALLCAGVFALPVHAVDGGGGSEGSGTLGIPTTSSATQLGAYIVSATATSVTGGEVAVILPGEAFNVVVQVADRVSDNGALQSAISARGDDAIENYISSRLISSNFLHEGPAEVGPNYLSGTDSFQYVDEHDPNLFYYRYTLIFRNVVWLGGANTFAFNVSYPHNMLEYKELSFTIGQCIDPSAQEGEDGEGDASRTPHLMVRSSSYGNQAINAGTPFTLAVTVYATKGNEALDDVTVTLDLRSEGITLQDGTLSQYLGSMKAGSTQEVYFTILPSIAFTGGVADIGVSMQGFGANTGAESTGSVAISVPIEQPDRFEITGTEISDTLYVGEGGSVSLTFVNKGRNPISNLEASISGTNLGADMPQQYLGNLAEGTESSVDFDLYPEEEGPVSGVITLTYEGADGSVKTLTQDFTSNAMMMVYDDPGMMMDPEMMEEPKRGMPLWGWGLIAAAVVGGGTAGVVLVRKRRKKKALAALEANDEDF